MENPRTRSSSIDDLFGSCSSRRARDSNNTSAAITFARHEQEHSQEPSGSQALGYAMGRYLNQALQEEPWSLAVKQEQTGGILNEQQTDGLAKERQDEKQQERRGSTAQGR